MDMTYIHGRQYEITIRATYHDEDDALARFETAGDDHIYPRDTPILKAEQVEEPMPTTPFTVIDATHKDGGKVYRLTLVGNDWHGDHGTRYLPSDFVDWTWTLVREGVE